MHSGRYVFSQVVDFVPRYEFDRIVSKYNGNYHARELSCYNQFLHLLFGQLTGCSSLREICLCLEAHKGILYHLGFRNTVDSTSLSRANERRDYRIYEEFGNLLIGIVRPLYYYDKVPDVPLANAMLVLDSTTISVSIRLCAWALGKYSRGAVKMHALMDLRGSIPVFIHVTDGRCHDRNMLDLVVPVPFTFYVMDKAYVDFASFARFDAAGAYFVTRAKDNMRYEVEERNYNIDESYGLLGDCTVRLTGVKTAKLYPKPLLLVEYRDPDSGETLRFITNNFDISALEVANLYRNRWQIEVFFKWIKQNFVIKTLWGYSENAVKTHLWMAICAYLVVARIKATYDTPYSITEILSILHVSALEKTSLKELLSSSETLIQNHNVNEPNLFD